MPAPRRRGPQGSVEYVVVERDSVQVDGEETTFEVEPLTKTVDRAVRRSHTGGAMSTPTDTDYDSDDDKNPTTAKRPFVLPTATPSGPPSFQFTMTIPQPMNSALADNKPIETVVVSLQPPARTHHEGRLSQTTAHLLIAAGSIGATIVIVMIILGLYTMRKRGLSFADVINNGKDTVRRHRRPPPPPSKYGMDSKKMHADEYSYPTKEIYPPRMAAGSSRSGSLSTQTPLQPLGRSDSFNLNGLERKSSMNKSFLVNDAPIRQSSHRRDLSGTPSSPILPIQDPRRSASTRNTRSLVGDEEALRYSDPPQQYAPLPAPPTFRQFLSNRPSISQRPGIGGNGMASRFSWTNSNAPQTPHDASRDTVPAPLAPRESVLTTRSSVPRFRTIDSWVNQQSNRVEEQKLKQQFRMTQSSTSSEFDTVPEMPAVPKGLKESSGLAGKDIRHQRHETSTTILTAPVFKQHPGTEVRFSVRSEVPSEVLDMGRKNVAL